MKRFKTTKIETMFDHINRKSENIRFEHIEMNGHDLGVLKYYKEGDELCGFEGGHVWENLRKNGYLDGDLELTPKARDFIKNYKDWESVVSFKNQVKVTIKP